MGRYNPDGAYEPDQDEIAQACRSFQDAWSEHERTKRAGTNAPLAVEIACEGSRARRKGVFVSTARE